MEDQEKKQREQIPLQPAHTKPQIRFTNILFLIPGFTRCADQSRTILRM